MVESHFDLARGRCHYDKSRGRRNNTPVDVWFKGSTSITCGGSAYIIMFVGVAPLNIYSYPIWKSSIGIYWTCILHAQWLPSRLSGLPVTGLKLSTSSCFRTLRNGSKLIPSRRHMMP